MQARRAERPSSRPYATCCRRAGTLTILFAATTFITSISSSRSATSFFSRASSAAHLRLELPQALDVVRLENNELASISTAMRPRNGLPNRQGSDSSFHSQISRRAALKLFLLGIFRYYMRADEKERR